MKFHDLKNIVSNSELSDIFAVHSKEGDISSDDVVAALLNHSERKKYIDLFLSIAQSSTHEKASGLVGKLVKKLHKYEGNDKMQLWDKTVASLYSKLKTQESLDKSAKDKQLPEAKKLVDSSTFKLSQLGNEYQKIIADKKYLESISKAIKNFTRIKKDDSSFDFVSFQGFEFAFSSLPKSPEKAKKYMESVLEKGGTLFVSCHESTEAATKCRDFWKNELVLKSGLNGASVVKITEEILQTSLVKNSAQKTPQLIESTLELDDGRKISHIHFDGWIDRSGCPDDVLLNVLLKRMDELSPDPRWPKAINCHGGVGRTGEVAYNYLIRKHIEDQIQHSQKEIGDIEVNVPKLISDLRQYRELSTSGYHITQVYSSTDAYFQRLVQSKK